jgi:hypothetical protein
VTDYRKNGSVVGGGGFANPMTNAGDMIVGGVAGAPARLAAGSAGYIQRIVGGTPTWRELSAAGLVGDRPNAVATREGQTYWSTDAAAGSELAMCVHKGGTTYDWEILAYGAPGLPVATGAGEVPLSTGAGTTYVAGALGLAGTLAARPEAAVAYLGRTYFANNVAPGGALYECITDGAGGYAWATIFLGSDGDVAGTAMIADGSDGLVKTSADVSALLAASTTAGMLSALSLSWTEIAASAFTHTPGAVTGGVASVVSSRLHTELAGVISDDLSGGFNGPRHEIALPVDDGNAWSVAARISYTGLDTNGRISLSLRRTTVQILGATIRDSGNLETFSDVAAPTSTIAAGFASGDWLRLTRRGGIMEVYTGTGASLAAAVWTWRASIAVAAGQLPLTLTVSMAQYSSGPSSPPLTSDVGPVYAKSGL